MLPWWVPAGQPPGQFLAIISKLPGLPAGLAWIVVLMVVALLCADAEIPRLPTRHGKTLSIISIATLLLVLTMTVRRLTVTS
jgi:hypothetical protein